MDLFKKGVDPVWGEVLCLGERFQIQALTPQNQWPPGLSTLPGFTRSLSTSGQVQCPLPVKSFFGGGVGGRGTRAQTVFHTHVYRTVMSTMLENGICGMSF